MGQEGRLVDGAAGRGLAARDVMPEALDADAGPMFGLAPSSSICGVDLPPRVVRHPGDHGHRTRPDEDDAAREDGDQQEEAENDERHLRASSPGLGQLGFEPEEPCRRFAGFIEGRVFPGSLVFHQGTQQAVVQGMAGLMSGESAQQRVAQHI